VRERGSVLLPLMGLLAAMALVTVAVARDGLQRHREARRTHMRAVARNLAEAGIVAGKMGRGVPAGLFGTSLEGHRGWVQLNRAALSGGRYRLKSTAVIRTREAESMRYVIEVTLGRGPDGGVQTLSWRERQLTP